MNKGTVKMKVNFKKLDKNAHAPTYGSEYAAGADIYALTNGETVKFAPGRDQNDTYGACNGNT